MLKIKHEDIARLLGITRKYSYLMLHREGLTLKQENVDKVLMLLVRKLFKRGKI